MKTRLLLVISIVFLITPIGVFARTSPEQMALIKESNARADIVESVQNAVVHIHVEKVVSPGGDRVNNPFELFDDDLMNRFFQGRNQGRSQRGPAQRYKQEGMGTGSIIDTQGHILTNNHVVGDADKITVRLLDGREFQATVVGTDPLTDVAVIKIEAENLGPIPIGDSDQIRIGETVIAIGNPFGLSHTVTMGIVSAKGRSNMDIADYEDFIQTDAAINPGNSGGPLINLKGEIVGINTAIFTRSGGYQGVGFSVPINMAQQVMKQLIAKGEVSRGWLGIVLQDISTELADAMNLESKKGALISDVMRDSPAEKTGLRRGDVIVGFNGKNVGSADQLKNLVGLHEPDDKMSLLIIRNGKEMRISGKLGTRPVDGSNPNGQPGGMKKLGLALAELTPELAQRYQLTQYSNGVVVTGVAPNSIAENAGLRTGLLVMEVNQQKINTISDFSATMKDVDFEKGVLMLVGTQRGAIYAIFKAEM